MILCAPVLMQQSAPCLPYTSWPVDVETSEVWSFSLGKVCGWLGFAVFPYIANYFREAPILLVLSLQKHFSSSLSLALRGWKNTDMSGKPASALNGLEHVNVQLNFLLEWLATKWAGISGHPRVSFFSDAQVKARRVLFQMGECVEEEMSTLSFEYSDKKIFFLSVNFCWYHWTVLKVCGHIL